jgi:hypothetical protein
MNMDRRLFLGSAVAMAFAPPARAASGFAVTRTDAGLLMPASVKGHATRAIFDCGTSQCSIDGKLARSLGIAAVQAFTAQAAYDGFQAGRSDPVDLTIGDRTFRLPLMIMPLDEIGDGVGMLIGRDVLGDTRLDLDLPNRRASFRTAGPPPGMTPVRMIQGRHGDLSVQVDVEGVAANASLDSGNTLPLMIRQDWFDRTNVLRGHRLTPWVGDDLSGEASIAMTDVKTFGFGGARLRDIPAEVSKTRLAYEINLGLPVLERFHSFWDLANETLWLSAAAGDLARPFEHERSGIACARVGPVLKVVFVVPDSPAARAGFKADDEIVKIDEKPVAALSEQASLAWKSDPARTSVTLTMGSGEARRLVLRDYF